MSRHSVLWFLGAIVTLLTVSFGQSARRAMTFEDFLDLDSISDLNLSPNGALAAFVVTDYSLNTNRGDSDIWIVRISNGSIRQLTRRPGTDHQPRWSPDGRRLAFLSNRDGSNQIYVVPAAGGEARRISKLRISPANLAWSPNGDWLAFSADVAWPQRTGPADPFPTEALIWEELLFRHWNEWRAGVRSHLFLIPSTGGEARDLTPFDTDYPTLALGGRRDVVFAPDSRNVLVVANLEEPRATSTNNDILSIPISSGSTAIMNLTETNRANDTDPVFSPDGRWMAYRAHARAGFEADRFRLIIRSVETGKTTDLTQDWNLSIGEIVWAPDSRSIYATVEENARNIIYRIAAPGGQRDRIHSEGHTHSLQITPDGKAIVCLREDAQRPDEVYSVDLSTGSSRQLTHVNDNLLAQLEMNALEEFRFKGARDEQVHGLLLRPPFFDERRKYPLVYLIHGGPQGAMLDDFHPRWNYQMFAAPGYVVAMVNFHGSTGYGQDFTDSISGHWGDYPYEDLMKGLDHLLTSYSFIDPNRVAAAGASYGGYMIYWIGTQNRRFACLISHDGVFNAESMWGSTEELWFPEWEFRGTPWRSRDVYRRWSPHNFAQNLGTPMLIVHGQLDYRLDISQGLEAFSSLRRQGVPSRFLYFPDEGHWVLKPRNRKVWWNEVQAWLAKYLKD